MVDSLKVLIRQEPAFFNDSISDQAYHGDRTTISRSDIAAALKSPAHFLTRYQNLVPQEETPALKFGQAAHLLMLEPQEFRRRFVESPDFGDQRSVKNRELKARFLSDQPPGTLVLTPNEMEQLTGMTEALVKHPIASALFKDGAFERAGYFTDPETGLRCRFKPDCVSKKGSALVDYKTCREADAKSASKNIYAYNYDLQLAYYSLGLKQFGIDPEIRAVVFQEKEPPYAVGVYVLDDAFMEIGERKMRLGLGRIKNSIETGDFGGYQTEAENISPPTYAMYDWEGV